MTVVLPKPFANANFASMSATFANLGLAVHLRLALLAGRTWILKLKDTNLCYPKPKAKLLTAGSLTVYTA